MNEIFTLEKDVQRAARESGHSNYIALTSCWVNKWLLGCRYASEVQVVVDGFPAPVSFEKSQVMRGGKPTGMRSEGQIGDGLPLELNGKHPVSILTDFANICAPKITVELVASRDEGDTSWAVTCLLNGAESSRGAGSSKKEARQQAALACLQVLSAKPEHEPALRRAIQGVDIEGIKARTDCVPRGVLLMLSPETTDPLHRSNRGREMMQRLWHWRPDRGLGAREDGVTEPISLRTVVRQGDDRAGLGFSGGDSRAAAALKVNVEAQLLEFARGGGGGGAGRRELRFSELSREERSIVHRVCRQYHLTHKSYGAGADRFVLVTKE